MRVSPVTDKSWIIIIVCAIAILFTLSTYLPDKQNNPNNTDNIGYAINLYQNFSPTVNSFSSGNSIDFASTENSKSASFSISDDAVYKIAYVSVNGSAWQPITLTGTVLSGNWLKQTTTGTFNIPRANIPNNTGTDNYLIIYSCTKTTSGSASTWDCHNNKWQIKTFNTTKTETGGTINRIITDFALSYIAAVSANTYDTLNDMPPELSIDGDINDDSRWSGNGDGTWIKYTFKNSMQLTGINILFYKSDARISRFTLQYSLDDNIWTNIGDYSSSGTSVTFETFSFPTITAKYFRIVGHGNTESIMANWTSIIEVTFNNSTQIIKNSMKIYIIGDSTAAYYPTSSSPLTGWGMKLQQYFNTANVIIVNNAVSGASSKSYLTTSSWTDTQNAMSAGDYLFIQFGHNDEPGHDASVMTDPYTTYQDYLQVYIDAARAKGVYPVLLTPVERNIWGGAILTESHVPYPAAMIALANEQNVPLIDLTNKTRILYYSLGITYLTNNFFAPGDYTHFQLKGANETAKLIIKGLQDLGSSSSTSALLPYIKNSDSSNPLNPLCGDGTCSSMSENCSTCSSDCGACSPPSTTGKTYYVATPANGGSDNNPGTITQPFATWQKGFNVIAAGDILYIRGGTYTGMLGSSGSNYFGVLIEGKSGTAAKHITISAYNGETPILDGSSLTSTSASNIGIGLYNAEYWDFIGLSVTNFKQYSDNIYHSTGWDEYNVAHITHTLCSNYHCGDGFVLEGTHDDIHYTDCDSYENADRYADPSGALPGSLANGFYATPGTGDHIYYSGCRAWNNSDDGWDTFDSYGGYIELTNCWAFNNGQYLNIHGDGSGFKLGRINGPKESGIQRTLKNCIASGNTGIGFDQNSGSAGTIVQIAVYNGLSSSNKAGGFNFYYDNLAIIRNCISYNEQLNSIGKSSSIDHNSWQNGLSVSSGDFTSVNASQLSRSRKYDGSLPDITYGHLAQGSDLIDAGTQISGIPYNGNAPDLGAFETG